MLEFMHSIDERYRAKSGLEDRRFFSIFYSQIIPSPILILGYNPGGDPESWTSTEYAVPLSFQNGEHEYVDYDYPIAKAMSCLWRIPDSAQRSGEIPSLVRRSMIVSMVACATWLSS
jgi:hypothetical protein